MLNLDQELKQGRYRITKQIGKGKTTSFYEGFDKVSTKTILLKEILDESGVIGDKTHSEIRKTNFDEDAHFFGGIKHEGFIDVTDHFTIDDKHYLVMESVKGKNVGEIIKSNNKLVSLANILDWSKQILESLDYLHKLTPTVLYFNLKPSNFYLTEDGEIKLLAAGIAGRSGADGKIKSQSFDKANLNYSPLEIIWEKLDPASQRVILNGFDEGVGQELIKSPDERSDIYSLGATLYHLLTGKLPVNALERSIELLDSKPDPLRAPKDINSGIAEEVSDALMKSLEIKRENRFQTALAMCEELENIYILLRERKIRELRRQNPVAQIVPVSKPEFQKVPDLHYENPQAKTEESKQLELIKQKLREAEEQKRQAEKRAVAAERRLTEIKQHEAKNDILELSELPEFAIEFPETPQVIDFRQPTKHSQPVREVLQAEIIEGSIETEEILDATVLENKSVDEEKQNELPVNSSADFGTLFAEPPKENKFLKRFAAATVGILMVGGAIFGILNFMPKTVDATNTATTTNQITSVVETPAPEPQPSVEPTPEIEKETTPELTEAQTSADLPETKQRILTEKPEKPTAIKQKTSVPQIATAKQPEQKSTKTKNKTTVDDLINDKSPKKKKVTVDDLISDN